MPKEKNCIICGKKFTPYSSSQKQCGDEECKLEMFRKNSYTKRRYKMQREKIKEILRDILFELDSDEAVAKSKSLYAILELAEFTMDDLEKLK